MRRIAEKLRDLLPFLRAKSGNVAILFSIAIIPIVGAMGAAVDYSMATANRTSMQKALDATALALAKLMPISQSELNSKGWDLFRSSTGTLMLSLEQSDLVIDTSVTGKLILTVTGHYTPQISGLMGIQTFPVVARSAVNWGMQKLELALALDNTGSMADNNKMTELKAAAKNLLVKMQQSAKSPGDVKVSIIPFHINVRVDTAGFPNNSSWLKFDKWDEDNKSCFLFWCTYKNRNQWDGCIEDRDQNYDTLDTAPTSSATKFPAKQCPWSLTTLYPLSYDWTALSSKIDAMQPDGNTNVQIGLAWAWHSLTSTEPLTQAAAASSSLNKIIILMTDGQNTQSRYYNTDVQTPTAWEVAQMDARTLTTCTNIKAAGIKIYSIRVIDGNADMLRSCASDPSMFYDVQVASELNAVFNSIGSALAKLYISQ